MKENRPLQFSVEFCAHEVYGQVYLHDAGSYNSLLSFVGKAAGTLAKFMREFLLQFSVEFCVVWILCSLLGVCRSGSFLACRLCIYVFPVLGNSLDSTAVVYFVYMGCVLMKIFKGAGVFPRRLSNPGIECSHGLERGVETLCTGE